MIGVIAVLVVACFVLSMGLIHLAKRVDKLERYLSREKQTLKKIIGRLK